MGQNILMSQTKTLKLGVLGSTLSYSKSPQIQLAGIKHLGLEGDYEKYEISAEDFETEMPKLLGSVHGLNVTIPYKEKVLKYLNYRDELVTRIGATNTLVISEKGIHGYNTDYYGFMKSLENHDLKDKKVSLIGAGGASKSVIVALEDMGVAEINVYVRNLSKTDGTLPHVKNTELNLRLYTDEEDLSDTSLIINATPVGQGRLAGTMPLTETQLISLQKGTLVYDLIYSDTLFLQNARKTGLETIDGSSMLILQAVKSLSIWSGTEIDEALIKTMTEAFNKNASHC